MDFFCVALRFSFHLLKCKWSTLYFFYCLLLWLGYFQYYLNPFLLINSPVTKLYLLNKINVPGECKF